VSSFTLTMKSLGRKLKNLKISKSTRAVETSLDVVSNVAADAEQNTSSVSFYEQLWGALSESAARPFYPTRWSLDIPAELLQAIIEEHLAADNVSLRVLERCCKCLRDLVRAIKYRNVHISSHSEAGCFSPVGFARILAAFPEVGKWVRGARATSGEHFGGPLGVDDAQRRCDAWTFIFERMRVSFIGLRTLDIEFRGVFWAAGSMNDGLMRAIWGVLKMGVVESLSLVGGTWPVSVFGIAARDMEKVRFAPRRVLGPAQTFGCVPIGARELCRPVIAEFDLEDVDGGEIEMLLGVSGWLGLERTLEMDLGIPWVYLSALNGVWPACRALQVLRIKPRWKIGASFLSLISIMLYT